MESIPTIEAILLVHILAWLTPGPLFFIIIRNSLIYSRGIWFFTALGFSLWNFTHIILAVSGISLLIQSYNIMLYAVKILGILYLVYLWIKTLIIIPITKKLNLKSENNIQLAPINAIKMGFLASMSSVGAYLFFASIFSTVMWSSESNLNISILSIAMPLNTFIMASLLNIFFTSNFIKSYYEKYCYLVNRYLWFSLIILAWVSLLDFVV